MLRIYIGEIPLDLSPIDELLAKIQEFISVGSKNKIQYQIVTLNSLMYNYCFKDFELRECIKKAAIVIPDSIGIILAGILLGKVQIKYLKRTPGIDLMLKICELSQQKKYRIFLLGTKPEIIFQTAKQLKIRFPELNIVGFHHGYFTINEEKEIIKELETTKPDILFVGLDVPRQEKWIYKNLKALSAPVVMGIGGSFDILSGKLRRAPKLFRILGLEWTFRFFQEPWRIRRIMKLPVFLFRIFLLKIKPRITRSSVWFCGLF